MPADRRSAIWLEYQASVAQDVDVSQAMRVARGQIEYLLDVAEEELAAEWKGVRYREYVLAQFEHALFMAWMNGGSAALADARAREQDLMRGSAEGRPVGILRGLKQARRASRPWWIRWWPW